VRLCLVISVTWRYTELRERVVCEVVSGYIWLSVTWRYTELRERVLCEVVSGYIRLYL
jgi:hypothetical protein